MNSIYTTGGIKQAMIAEYIRGFAWGCGLFTIAIPFGILTVWLGYKFINWWSERE